MYLTEVCRIFSLKQVSCNALTLTLSCQGFPVRGNPLDRNRSENMQQVMADTLQGLVDLPGIWDQPQSRSIDEGASTTEDVVSDEAEISECRTLKRVG